MAALGWKSSGKGWGWVLWRGLLQGRGGQWRCDRGGAAAAADLAVLAQAEVGCREAPGVAAHFHCSSCLSTRPAGDPAAPSVAS